MLCEAAAPGAGVAKVNIIVVATHPNRPVGSFTVTTFSCPIGHANRTPHLLAVRGTFVRAIFVGDDPVGDLHEGAGQNR